MEVLGTLLLAGFVLWIIITLPYVEDADTDPGSLSHSGLGYWLPRAVLWLFLAYVLLSLFF